MKLSHSLRSIGTIYLSKSRCIYENLAFEEWLFRHHDLKRDGEALLLWSNTPAVVIGRYQNPFLEANLHYCDKNSIRIARRHSGGGAVYHDLGNLNISMLTSQARHCRQRNLRLLADFLNLNLRKYAHHEYGGDTTPLVGSNERDDLVFAASGCKISGTAARISHGRAYHHLTLLVDVPLNKLKSALDSNLQGKLETNATKSVKAKSVGYLAQKLPHIDVATVSTIVMEAFSSQFTSGVNVTEYRSPSVAVARFSNATATESHPGLNENWRQLHSEDWIFGHTPPFTLTTVRSTGEEPYRIVVDKGRIRESLHYEFPIGSSFYHAYKESKYF